MIPQRKPINIHKRLMNPPRRPPRLPIRRKNRVPKNKSGPKKIPKPSLRLTPTEHWQAVNHRIMMDKLSTMSLSSQQSYHFDDIKVPSKHQKLVKNHPCVKILTELGISRVLSPQFPMATVGRPVTRVEQTDILPSPQSAEIVDCEFDEEDLPQQLNGAKKSLPHLAHKFKAWCKASAAKLSFKTPKPKVFSSESTTALMVKSSKDFKMPSIATTTTTTTLAATQGRTDAWWTRY